MTDQIETPRARAMAALRLLTQDKAERAQAALAAIQAVMDEHKCGLSVEWVRGNDGNMVPVPVVAAIDYTEADLRAYIQAENQAAAQEGGE